ncbi:uncharacterized protein BDV14DRAFT_184465 [Aspergillus stella-maris]|uniref:uncharacterized protein n=1 Tax=Aspergillus stella-maris TaxID=1810926 RepID=UPI003CCCFF6B
MFVRSRFLLLIVVALFLCIVFLHQHALPSQNVVVTRPPQYDAGNSTIGFQQIFALSQHPSWRTRGLEAAANLTGLEIIVPPQPPVDDQLAQAFANIEPYIVDAQQPAPGASKAWLAHLDMLKHVYQLNLETALILEDDADWDVALRQQMQNVSTAVRNLTKAPETDLSPYGRSWDVLWLGHCGERWDDQIETIVFDDAHVNPHQHYQGFWPDELALLPDLKRAVYWSSSPVCTFAYAVTHEGARKILHLSGAGQDEAFDVKLQHECQKKRLSCVSVVPEMFHQYFPPLQFDVKSDVDVGNHRGKGPKDEEFESLMGSTENLVYSARCQALWQKQCPRV